jgi:hypothetical protein
MGWKIFWPWTERASLETWTFMSGYYKSVNCRKIGWGGSALAPSVFSSALHKTETFLTTSVAIWLAPLWRHQALVQPHSRFVHPQWEIKLSRIIAREWVTHGGRKVSVGNWELIMRLDAGGLTMCTLQVRNRFRKNSVSACFLLSMLPFWVLMPCGLVDGHQRIGKHTVSIFKTAIHPWRKIRGNAK